MTSAIARTVLDSCRLLLERGGLDVDLDLVAHTQRRVGDAVAEGDAEVAPVDIGGGATAEEKNIHYTKTPGGTGPVLVAKLFENFYALNS